MDTETEAETETQRRMVPLEGDPAVMRDTITGNNYHLESSLEVAALSELINNMNAHLSILNLEITNLVLDKEEMLDEAAAGASREDEANG